MKTKVVEFHGLKSDFQTWHRKLLHEFRRVHQIEFQTYMFSGKQYCHGAFNCVPYTPDELFEMDIYGDPDHEAYLMSDDHESDHRSEQWDWLKNA